jgi:Kef-type K+ transport system membrane component KefB
MQVMEIRTLLLQIVVICAAARALGWLFAKLHQPRVVGEILAGILLGPSLLGWLAPQASAFLFPKDGMGPLYFLSQIGLVLFMFQVGSELDVHEVRRMGRAVVLTSNISVLVPFLAGAALAWFLHPKLSNDSVPASTFAIFLGTAMSITAFPVLARILAERNMLQSKVGSIAIACAAVDDLTAWCLLAFLMIKVHAGSGAPLAFTLGGVAVYLLIMLGLIRPLLARIPELSGAVVSADTLALVLLFAFLSAWATDRLGVHALFGAFLAGVILPKSSHLASSLVQRLETVNSVLLLPLFFAFTGLRTSVRLLSGGTLWAYCALIIVVAVFGKLSGSVISVRSAGMSWREALSIGVLLNTRGLIELVILNVGLDLGVISPLLFSMMVIMALVTTFMATPVLDLLDRIA